jgi:hypothetical protein
MTNPDDGNSVSGCTQLPQVAFNLGAAIFGRFRGHDRVVCWSEQRQNRITGLKPRQRTRDTFSLGGEGFG